MSGAAPEAANANFAFAHALLDELARAGVAHVCSCPGSRSAPLAVAAERVGMRAMAGDAAPAPHRA